jgi:hypothetical protein
MGETIMTILRKALLGGAALAVMTTGAQADELTALKAQLEALQNRVDTMEAAPASYEGKSLLTFERGQASNTWDVVSSQGRSKHQQGQRLHRCCDPDR